MKVYSLALALVLTCVPTTAFVTKTLSTKCKNTSNLSMVLEKPPKVKKLAAIETLKSVSGYLMEPLQEQLYSTESIGISKDAFQILKYHGSYMQTDREKKKVRGEEKDYQFMLRLKQPGGEMPAELFRLLDDLSRDYGQGDLRATTRMCFQMHGIRKGNLKKVIASIMDVGSSTIGACGDVSRNVMVTPAPFNTREYELSREWGKVFAQLFRPLSPAFDNLWLDGKQPALDVKWNAEVQHHNIDEAMLYDSGRGIILPDSVEPLYGDRYLPRKFKIGVTPPTDNSLDIYTNDIGCVVITDDKGELEGFNIMVGGGMGRTHNKPNTFARAADHLGYVPKEDAMELMKSILASQRDHGNRDVRANARMKYLVHTLGIDNFRRLVESYFGKPVQPWREIPEWKYNDWMGWWDQGDGKLFYGLHVDSGRVKDEGDFRLKTVLRVLVDKFDLDMVLSPTQSILLKDIRPEDKDEVDQILLDHGIKPIEEVDPMARLAMACPALPLCGLAQTEAERWLPMFIERVRAILTKLDINEEEIMIRITGCPNGCARPYMAELAFVGDGTKTYQVWLGGSPVLTRTAYPYKAKMKIDKMEETMEPILAMFKEQKQTFEAFGDFCHRIGADKIEEYEKNYVMLS